MSVGGFTVGSVISPGVTTRVPSECDGAPAARETQPRPNGHELNGFARGTSAAELSLAAGAGLGGVAGAGLGLGGVAEVLPGLLDFASGCVLVAHNAPFDLGFLVAGCGELGLAWPGFTVLDTVMLARHVMDPDEVPDCKLGTLAGFFRARTAPNHRALADARATADVLSWLIRRLAHRGIRTIRQLSAWPGVVP